MTEDAVAELHESVYCETDRVPVAGGSSSAGRTSNLVTEHR